MFRKAPQRCDARAEKHGRHILSRRIHQVSRSLSGRESITPGIVGAAVRVPHLPEDDARLARRALAQQPQRETGGTAQNSRQVLKPRVPG